MRLTKTITLTSGYREYSHTLPAKREVCPDCEGEGAVLHEAIRSHAYSADEFHEAFDDDEREEYFKGGRGRYGVRCPTCKGDRLVVELDREAIERTVRHGAKLLECYDTQCAWEAQEAANDAYVRQQENGGRE